MKNGKLKESRVIFKEAKKEFAEAKKRKDELKARDAASKAYLSLVKACEYLFMRKGLKKEALPRTYRGLVFCLGKFGDSEIRKEFYSLRDIFHIDAYYDGIVDFKRMPEYYEILKKFIQRVENGNV